MKSARGAALILFLVLAVTAGSLNAGNPGVLFQYSTIQALMEGVYDGELTYGELRKQGDFGLGTFNALDGEMVAVDGKFYQVKADGGAYPVPDSLKTPFADVTFFKADKTLTVDQALDCRQLETYLARLLPSPNLAYAIRIDGVFPYIKTRSVPPQQRPYPPLLSAAGKQTVFEFHNIKGVMVGFWAPKYLAGVDVSGYHLHFLTADRKAGGHLLDCRVQKATVQIGRLGEFHLQLPQNPDFLQADLTEDKANKIEQVEK
jgi:acetolactate decarboxylase